MSKLVTDPEALMLSFPSSLSLDDDKESLAEIIAEELAHTLQETDKAMIFPSIDTLPEELLDILAYDFKIEWYEAQAPVWNKRQAVKDAFAVHRYKGTKYAVETALRSMFNSAEVSEWFEYGGDPFHFKVTVYGSTSSNLKKLYSKIQYAKNLRSVMDDAVFVLIPEKPFEAFAGMEVSSRQKSVHSDMKKDDCGIFERRADVIAGAAVSSFKKAISSALTHTESGQFELKRKCFASLSVSSIQSNLHSRMNYNNADNKTFVINAGRFIGMRVASFQKNLCSHLKYTSDILKCPDTGCLVAAHGTALVKKIKLGGIKDELE